MRPKPELSGTRGFRTQLQGDFKTKMFIVINKQTKAHSGAQQHSKQGRSRISLQRNKRAVKRLSAPLGNCVESERGCKRYQT